MRVSVANVSVVDLTCCWIEKPAEYEEIVSVVKRAAEGLLKGMYMHVFPRWCG